MAPVRAWILPRLESLHVEPQPHVTEDLSEETPALQKNTESDDVETGQK